MPGAGGQHQLLGGAASSSGARAVPERPRPFAEVFPAEERHGVLRDRLVSEFEHFLLSCLRLQPGDRVSPSSALNSGFFKVSRYLRE